MKSRLKSCAKFLIFLVLIVSVVFLVNRLLMAKYMSDEREPQTETYEGFYGMEKNTVDVILLGTSHMASGLNPQDLYDRAQIRSYNLASSAQAIWNSYYWLQEALKRQKPSAVVLDCFALFSDFKNSEAGERKALDNMREGAVKYDAAKASVALDDKNAQSVISYFLHFIRYHARWKELSEKDFIGLQPVEKPSLLKGFWFYPNIAHKTDFEPIQEQADVDPEPFLPDTGEYLDKITELCRENEIQLVLVKAPVPIFKEAQHLAVSNYAREHDLPFYDFNTARLLEACGFDYELDMDNTGSTNAHANTAGARKMSYYLADELVNNGWATPREDPQWESSKEFNDNAYKDFLLHNEGDVNAYLEMLDDDRYTVFIAVRDEASLGLSEESKELLARLGLQEDWSDALQKSYIAVIDRGNVVYEDVSDSAIAYSGTFRDGLSIISLKSAGWYVGDTCSIKVENKEHAVNKRGLNIVVYNNERRCVIDSVCFDTHVDENTVSR